MATYAFLPGGILDWVISLFWLALAEIGGKRLRLPTLIIGVIIFVASLGAISLIEVIFIIMRGGAL